jgi:hypothetical protein
MSSVSRDSELDELPGLSAAKRAVSGIAQNRSEVHAVLFYGEEGSGKEPAARALALYWLCTNPTPEGACGECRACQAERRGNASDLLTIAPGGPSALIKQGAFVPEPENQTISLQEFFRTLPLLGRFKVAAIHDADRMNDAAANVFLKTLEEPPAYARIVLTTSEVGRIRPTVRSRCLLVPCELPTADEWRRAFPEAEPWVETLSRRAPERTRRILESPDEFREIFELARESVASGPAGALALAERFRGILDRMQAADESNVRVAATSALKFFGDALSAHGAHPSAGARIAEAHRRIQGNAQAAAELDALFVHITRLSHQGFQANGAKLVPASEEAGTSAQATRVD